MSVPWQSARGARGLLLVSGDPARVASWVRRGLVACRVTHSGRWTAVVPAEGRSRARAPYDDALTVLASRSVPVRLRPALGFFEIDGRAVVTVTGRGWRAQPRWVVWQPGMGVVRASGLQQAGPDVLVSAARAGGAERASSPAEVAGLLTDPRGDASGVVTELLRLLALPRWPEGHDGRLVEPRAQAVERFDARAAEEARHRREMEGL